MGQNEWSARTWMHLSLLPLLCQLHSLPLHSWCSTWQLWPWQLWWNSLQCVFWQRGQDINLWALVRNFCAMTVQVCNHINCGYYFSIAVKWSTTNLVSWIKTFIIWQFLWTRSLGSLLRISPGWNQVVS